MIGKVGKSNADWRAREDKDMTGVLLLFLLSFSLVKECLYEIGFMDIKKTLAMALFFCGADHALHTGLTCKSNAIQASLKIKQFFGNSGDIYCHRL